MNLGAFASVNMFVHHVLVFLEVQTWFDLYFRFCTARLHLVGATSRDRQETSGTAMTSVLSRVCKVSVALSSSCSLLAIAHLADF